MPGKTICAVSIIALTLFVIFTALGFCVSGTHSLLVSAVGVDPMLMFGSAPPPRNVMGFPKILIFTLSGVSI